MEKIGGGFKSEVEGRESDNLDCVVLEAEDIEDVISEFENAFFSFIN